MRPTEAIVAALLWTVSAIRLPSARRHPKERPLLVAFVALAVMTTVRPDGMAWEIDSLSGINNLSGLVKHLCAITAAAGVVDFLRHVSGRESRPTLTWRIGLPVAASTAACILFLASPKPTEVEDIMVAYADEGTVVAYGAVWLSYLAVALVGIITVAWRRGHEADRSLLRSGLWCVALGAVAGVGYVAHRIAGLVFRWAGWWPVSGPTDKSISSALLYTALVLIVVGSIVPAHAHLRRSYRHFRDFRALHGLWKPLTDAVPDVVLEPDRSSGSLTSPLAARVPSPSALRMARQDLYRRTIEIRDAILTLNDYVTEDTRDQAHAFIQSGGYTADEADAMATACWIEAARRARAAGSPTVAGAQVPPQGGDDLSGEVLILKRLTAAYASPVPSRFCDLVNR